MQNNKEVLLSYLKLKPNFHIHQLLSRIYEKEGDLFKSLKHINESIALNPREKSLKETRDRISIEILRKYLGTKKFFYHFDIVLSTCPDIIKSDDLHILISNLLIKLDTVAEIKNTIELIRKHIEINTKKMRRHKISDYKEKELLSLMRLYFVIADYRDSFEIMDYLFDNLNSSSMAEFLCPWGDDRKHSKAYLDFHIGELKRAKICGKLIKYKLFYLNLLNEYKRGEVNRDALINLRRKYPQLQLIKYRLSLDCLDRCEIKNAYDYMLEVVNKFKNDWYSLCKLGEILICLKKYEEGISCFKKAESKFEKSIDNIWTWEGEMYLLLGEYKKAISVLNKAISLNSTMAYCWRGASYYMLADIEKGLKDIEAAISQSYDDEAILWYGEMMLAKGNTKEAIKYFGEALNRHNNYDFAYLNRAIANCRMGNLKDASHDLKKVSFEMRDIVLKSLNIDIYHIPANQIEKSVFKILNLFRGNRRWEKYFLYIVS